jgi:hypothetical protein
MVAASAAVGHGVEGTEPGLQADSSAALLVLALESAFPQVRGPFRDPSPDHPVASCGAQCHTVCDIGVTSDLRVWNVGLRRSRACRYRSGAMMRRKVGG